MSDVGLQLLAASKEIARLNARVRGLETDLNLNASMLAKQCDLAREAEARVKELQDANRKMALYLAKPLTDVDK